MRFQEVSRGGLLGINGEADVLPLNYSRHLESVTYVADLGLLSNLLSIWLQYP